MAQFCMFGGHEGPLRPGRSICVTIFAGAELHRPPLARQIVETRQLPPPLRKESELICLTLFGGTEVVWPTLAEEYLALWEALRTGALTLEDWDRLVAQPGGDGPVSVHSITLFGAFGPDELPSEDKELDDLGLQRHLGHIPEEAVQTLMLAIGKRCTQRLAAVRRAVAIARSAGA